MWEDAARCPCCKFMIPERELDSNESGLCNYCEQRKDKDEKC